MNGPFRIAFFSRDLDIGGIEKVFLDYANYLSRNHKVSFILGNKKGGLLPLVDPSIKIYELASDRLKKNLFSLVKVLRENKFDVVISGSENCNILLALANSLCLRKTKIISSQHSFLNSDTSGFIHNYLLPWALKRSSITLCVSKGIKDMLLDMKLKPTKLEVLYNPIDRERIITCSKEKVGDLGSYIVFVGRMFPVKNVPFLFQSFQRFLKDHPSFKLVLVGDGPETGKLKRKAEELGLQEHLVWVGATRNPYPYIAGAELLALSSLSESLSNVVLEALCLGKTVVSTPCTGPIEILHAPTYGYVSNSFEDCEAFADLMSHAIEHRIPSSVLSEYSEKFSISISAQKLSTIINQVIRSK